jgi:hypothetical protein
MNTRMNHGAEINGAYEPRPGCWHVAGIQGCHRTREKARAVARVARILFGDKRPVYRCGE